MTILNKFLNIFRVITFTWIMYQMVNNLVVLANQTRENQCSESIKIPLDIFESSTNALRSNNALSALTSALTSLIPFIIIYVVPIFEILRTSFQYRIEGITSDGIVFWFLVLVNVILKNIWKEERPAAYKLCIKDKVSYGQPSGHAMQAVGIWTVCFILFLNKKKQKPKLEEAPNYKFNISWVFDSIFNTFENKYLNIGWILTLSILWLFNIPFVRYELQYNTILQIISGIGIGFAGGCIWGIIFNRFPQVARYYWMRTLFCILSVTVIYIYSQSFIAALPLVIELLLWMYQWRSKEDPRNDYSTIEIATSAKDKNKDEDWESNWSESDEKAWKEAVLEAPAKIFF